MVNLVSLCQLQENWSVRYTDASNTWRLWHKKSGMAMTASQDMYTKLWLLDNIHTDAHEHLVMSRIQIGQPMQESQERIEMLHQALNHAGKARLLLAVESGLFPEWNISREEVKKADFSKCQGCLIGNAAFKIPPQSASYRGRTGMPVKMGERVHCDLVFVRRQDKLVTNYLLGVEEASGYKTLVRLKNKNKQSVLEAIKIMQGFYRSFGHTVRGVHWDRETAVAALEAELLMQGITSVQVGAGTHERVVESAVGKIRRACRAMAAQLPYKLPLFLAPHLFEWAVQAENLLPNKHCPNSSPRAVLTGDHHCGRYIDFPFGSIIVCRNPNLPTAHDIDPKGTHAILVGRSAVSSTVKAWIPGRNVIVARDDYTIVRASTYLLEKLDIERHGPAIDMEQDFLQPGESEGDGQPFPIDDPMMGCSGDHNHLLEKDMLHESTTDGTHISESKDDIYSAKPYMEGGSLIPARSHLQLSDTLDHEQTRAPTNPSARPQRSRTHCPLEGGSVEVSKRGRKVIKHDYRNSHSQGFSSRQRTQGLDSGPMVGTMVVEARDQQAEKEQAILKEFQQMKRYEVFSLVDRREHIQRALPSFCFVVEKLRGDGSYEKTKARLVANGKYQNLPDRYDNFSPTVSHETLMILLNIAALEDLDVQTVDVTGAYLEATPQSNESLFMKLDRETAQIYMKLEPETDWNEYIRPDGSLIVKLNKSLYGLKTSAKDWNVCLGNVMKKDGFDQSQYDGALWQKMTKKGSRIYAIVWVDDILLAGAKDAVEETVASLQIQFQNLTIHNEKDIQYLGYVFERDREAKTMTVKQTKHIQNLEEHWTGARDYNVDTPHTENMFTIDQTPLLSSKMNKAFSSLIMKIMYISKTRPDIRLPCVYLSTKMQKPNEGDWKRLERLGNYVLNTKDLHMRITPATLQLHCSTDASFAPHTDRKSHTGVMLWLGDGCNNSPVEFRSVKQGMVTDSSTAAELVALHVGGQSVMWTRALLESMGFPQLVTEIEVDNKSAETMANRGPGMGGSKAIEVKYYWITQFIQNGSIRLSHVPTDQMLADGFTKPLPRNKFFVWRRRVLNLEE